MITPAQLKLIIAWARAAYEVLSTSKRTSEHRAALAIIQKLTEENYEHRRLRTAGKNRTAQN